MPGEDQEGRGMGRAGERPWLDGDDRCTRPAWA